jgi:hypothetical protein
VNLFAGSIPAPACFDGQKGEKPLEQIPGQSEGKLAHRKTDD